MGQLRFSIYGSWQLGLMIRVEREFIEIDLPFIQISIALTKEASGIEIFKWYFKGK